MKKFFETVLSFFLANSTAGKEEEIYIVGLYWLSPQPSPAMYFIDAKDFPMPATPMVSTVLIGIFSHPGLKMS